MKPITFTCKAILCERPEVIANQILDLTDRLTGMTT